MIIIINQPKKKVKQKITKFNKKKKNYKFKKKTFYAIETHRNHVRKMHLDLKLH